MKSLIILADSAQKDKQIFDLHIIIDLYANALRKSEVGLFEDAISRLYRVIELVAQHRLKSYGIETSNPSINQYELAYKAVTKEVYGFEKPLPTEIGLKNGFLLLFILQDFIIKSYGLNDIKEMFGIIRARDMSIIAHGLQLAGEKVFVNLNSLARSFIKSLCENYNNDFADLLSQHTFVKL
jgi:hypothetical protein